MPRPDLDQRIDPDLPPPCGSGGVRGGRREQASQDQRGKELPPTATRLCGVGYFKASQKAAQ